MSKIPYVLADAVYYAATTPDDGTLYDTLVKMFDTLDHVGVKVYREDETVKLPTYSKQGDACMDVYVHSIEEKDDRVVYHTGLHFKLPEDYEMEIRPRSSNTKTMAIMQNSPGTLDEGYTGELMIVHRAIDAPFISVIEYNVGDRVAQILVRHREQIIWDEVETIEELGETERGAGGFGSTGK
jgi:dUTP pyrophosphatase